MRLLRSLGRGLNTTRVVVLNLVFFFFLGLFLLSLFGSAEEVTIEPQTTLVLRPQGQLVEEYSSTPLDRALQESLDQGRSETRLRDLLKVLDTAAKDTRITQLFIDTNAMQGAGLAALLDLRDGIERFKASGKPVVAMGDAMSQHQYLLASFADEVWLAPGGMVWIDGYANMRQFFRTGLEKLAVDINLFRVGEYKSAMEPFIRDDMSPEAREAAAYWLGSLWETYLERVTMQRGIRPQALGTALRELPERIEAAGGDFTQVALEAGLVDRVMSRPEARQTLALRGAANAAGDGYRAIGNDEYLTLITPPAGLPARHDIKVLVAEGEIVRGRLGAGTISADQLSEQLRELGRDQQVRALVLRINSPGGDAQASEQIRREIQALQDSGKTVVVSMGDVAASGGYWIAMGADEIWASPSTITGSIGVFGMLPTFDRTLSRLGITTDGVGTTELAGTMRLDRPLDEGVRRIFQATTERVYADFIARVARHRSMSEDAVDAVARGRVWSGEQALERGLVDRLGGLDEAVDAAARMAGLGSNYRVGYHQPLLSPLELMLQEWLGSVAMHLPLSYGPTLAAPGGFVADLLQDLERIAAQDGTFTVAAHCMCRVR